MLQASTDYKQMLVWRELARARIPALEQQVVRRIRTEIDEYRDDPTGIVGTETRHAVRRSFQNFLTSGSGATLSPADAEVFRRLGRITYSGGRGIAPLQAAFRIANDAVLQETRAMERSGRLPQEVVAHLSATVGRYIAALARLTEQGYENALLSQRHRGERSHLVNLLLRRGGATPESVAELAAQVGWRVPTRCRAALVAAGPELSDDEAEATLAAMFSTPPLVGVVNGRRMVITPELPLEGAAARARDVSLTLLLGPDLALSQAWVSARLVWQLARLPSARSVLARGGVTDCDDHLIDLATAASSDAVSAMAEALLQPLAVLAPTKRYKLGTLLSAWLEYGGIKGDAPGVLDASRQTLHYRLRQLHVLFGDQLEDRDTRLKLILALRQELPKWAAAAEAAGTANRAAGDSSVVVVPHQDHPDPDHRDQDQRGGVIVG